MATNASSKGKTNEIVSYLVVIVVIGVALAAIIYVYKAQQLSTLPPEESQTVQTAQNNTTPKPTATPMPKAIPHGKIPFSATTTWPGPKFTGGSFDPYDPAKGSTMVITISVNDTQPVQKVWANVTSDHKTSATIPFHRVTGTDLSGDWQGTWTVDDTYLYTYMVTIQAQSANGPTKDEIALR